MGAFDGLAILATNLEANIDSASAHQWPVFRGIR